MKRLSVDRSKLSDNEVLVLDAFIDEEKYIDDNEALYMMAEEVAHYIESCQWNGAGYGPSDSMISEVLDYGDGWIIRKYQKVLASQERARVKLNTKVI